ncbi:MAG TPA: SpoIVB peptidase S55 domain-containing protein [Vicinamibacterales bacterium]|nr:SpoIVB peptidase S55 domain-containing protein [Vicinamibacterales bacterium]
MNLRTFFAAALALGVLAAAPVAQTTYLPLDQVRPGMIGVGRTVFSGTKLEDFKVEVLGVMRNVIGPKRNLILARLEGGPLAKTGVIAGMSGSPVYVDGKLMGAVSYSLGQFSTEPIAGITPIDEMIDATMMAGAARVTRPVAMSMYPTPRELLEIWARDLGRSKPFVEDASQALVLSGVSSDLSRMSAMLRPIAVPMIASGFDAAVFDSISPALSAAGFVPMSSPQSPGAGISAANTRPLQPGDAVGVGLLTGDFELGATGTVTHVDGDRVYAFGHPLYNLGPTQFPMTRAEVQVVLPSLMASSKLASFGEVVGTVQQDRATAIAGRLGPAPSMIPVTITLNSDRGPSRTFNFGVVRDFTFTPLLTYLSVANVLTSYERGAGPASFAIRGSASIRSEGDLVFEDIFSGDQPAGGASAYIAGPLTALLKNSGETVDVEKIVLTIDASEQQRSARIERVWLDTTRPRAGQDAIVNVALRSARGQEIIRQVPIQIPANLTGSLQLTVADAARTTLDDRRDTRGADLQRVSQMMRAFNRARRNNRLYVRLTSPDSGAIVNGEPMAGLPPSVLAVMESDRNSGTVGSLRTMTRGEWELALDFAVTGSRQLTLSLDQP